MLILLSNFNNEGFEKTNTKIKEVLSFIFKERYPDNPALDDLLKEIDKKRKIEDSLRILIKEVAKIEFPLKTWIDNMKIEFTPACDYNVFDQCFNTLLPIVKAKDDISHRLIFNLTPGTGIVGSLMTLMAIDSDRELFYYSQEKNEEDSDMNRLKRIEKKNVPLQNILSQAIATLDEA